MSLIGRFLQVAVQCSVFFTSSLFVAAQEGPPPVPNIPEITVKVNEVVVPVVVRNAQGESVGTLTKEDFQIFDDGKLQTVTSFSVIDRANASNSAAPGNDGLPDGPHPSSEPPRSFAFVFDDLNLSSSELTRAKQAVSRLFELSLPASDMAAVAATSGANSGFTRDQTKLQQAIRDLKPQPTYHSNSLDCPNLDYYQADLMLNKGDNSAMAAAISDAMVCAGLPHGQEAAAAQLAEQAAHRAIDSGEKNFRSNFDFLRFVINAMGKRPGDRTLILISPGFLTFSEEAMKLKSELLELASKANVRINAVDMRGVYTADLEASQMGGNPGAAANKTVYREKSASLSGSVMAELTKGTGGTFFHNSNALGFGLEGLFSGPKYLYLLTFSIDKLQPNKAYHSLTIKVKPKKLTVEARSGYAAGG